MDFNCGDLVCIKSEEELREILTSRGRKAEYQNKRRYMGRHWIVRYKLEGGGLVLDGLLDEVWDADMLAEVWHRISSAGVRTVLSNGGKVMTGSGRRIWYDTERDKLFIKQYFEEVDVKAQTLYQEAL